MPLQPSSPREEEAPRRRRKDYDREKLPTSSSARKISSLKPVHRRRSSRSRERGGEGGRESPRSSTAARKSSAPVSYSSSGVPAMERGGSVADGRPKTSYPGFSKAHSREAVGSLDDVAGNTKRDALATPEATEVGKESKAKRRNSTPAAANGGSGVGPLPMRVPPSPPLSAESQDMKRSRSGGSMRSTAAEVKDSLQNGRKSAEATTSSTPAKGSATTLHLRKEARFADSEVSSMPRAYPDERRSTPNSGYRATVSTGGSQPTSSVTDDSNPDSDATSIPEDRKPRKPADISTSRDEGTDLATDSPKTPTPADPYFPYNFPGRTKTPIIEVQRANAYVPSHSITGSLDPKTPMTAVPPPPPPPPPLVTSGQNAPRVDYLLKNGGLTSLIPRRLVTSALTVQQYSTYQTPTIGQMAPIEDYAKIFAPVNKRLDDYLYVLRHNGSLAVATGYKSVARRLLDKLSQVFARDISSQRCDCVICKSTPQPGLSDEEDSGISWGEILEFVSGRRELPQWPPFSIQPEDSAAGLVGTNQVPMQKLDIDVPEEYREHYIRQNQKTKKAVQTWLAQQPEYPSSPPEEADEDTLMFAMMTKLNTEQRNFFIALMHGQAYISPSRAPTPAERPAAASPALKKAAKALQRLYRLVRAPRDCECAMYLLNNPPQHGMLATLAEVNEQEWEILVSGRFDGFLWSGAETTFPPSASGYASPVSAAPGAAGAASRGPSRGANGFGSRNTTPFSGLSGMSFSRNQTPFSNLRNAAASPDGTPKMHPAPSQSVFPSRGPTPANGLAGNGNGKAENGGSSGSSPLPPPPVQLDEDTEIAVLAEVERNLFNDMERFEDAFEILHSRAELVRQLLRERSAGLSISSRQRRGGGSNGEFGNESIGIRLGTPASANTDFEMGFSPYGQDEEDEDGLADLASLAPDDSASQISVGRATRLRKRHERRYTPGLPTVDSGEEVSAGTGSVFEEERRSRFGMFGGRRSKY